MSYACLLVSLLLSLCSHSGCAGNADAYAVIRVCSCNSCFHRLDLILSCYRVFMFQCPSLLPSVECTAMSTAAG